MKQQSHNTSIYKWDQNQEIKINHPQYVWNFLLITVHPEQLIFERPSPVLY